MSEKCNKLQFRFRLKKFRLRYRYRISVAHYYEGIENRKSWRVSNLNWIIAKVHEQWPNSQMEMFHGSKKNQCSGGVRFFKVFLCFWITGWINKDPIYFNPKMETLLFNWISSKSFRHYWDKVILVNKHLPFLVVSFFTLWLFLTRRGDIYKHINAFHLLFFQFSFHFRYF